MQDGEEWDFESFVTTTKVYRNSREVLVDRIRLTEDDNNNFWGTKALCSIVLAGPQSRPVVEKLKAWSSQLASRLTSVRNLDDETTISALPLSSLGSTVLVSVSSIEPYLYVARIAAQSNEDIHRILQNSLPPLQFGVPFYKHLLLL